MSRQPAWQENARRGYAALLAHYDGSVEAMADDIGLTRQAVYLWKGIVPRRWVLELERKTKGQIRCWQIRPDLYKQEAAE